VTTRGTVLKYFVPLFWVVTIQRLSRVCVESSMMIDVDVGVGDGLHSSRFVAIVCVCGRWMHIYIDLDS
jgi:hypothetical protein